eukprot:351856-Chlamydomonas_euryale.AAC.4
MAGQPAGGRGRSISHGHRPPLCSSPRMLISPPRRLELRPQRVRQAHQARAVPVAGSPGNRQLQRQAVILTANRPQHPGRARRRSSLEMSALRWSNWAPQSWPPGVWGCGVTRSPASTTSESVARAVRAAAAKGRVGGAWVSGRPLLDVSDLFRAPPAASTCVAPAAPTPTLPPRFLTNCCGAPKVPAALSLAPNGLASTSSLPSRSRWLCLASAARGVPSRRARRVATQQRRLPTAAAHVPLAVAHRSWPGTASNRAYLGRRARARGAPKIAASHNRKPHIPYEERGGASAALTARR